MIDDERFMQMALRLAERGRGTTRPNPIVGAVVVKRGEVIGRGFHHHAGGPHAEIEALRHAVSPTRGATMYVTLEPCCHRGRTGPCTDALIAAGLSRIVVACRDPNPIVNGRGLGRLRRAGIQVLVGCLESEAKTQNRGFFRWISDARPHVTLKSATTLDGFTAPPNQRKGHIHWISSGPAQKRAHQMRAAHDAILVGVGTVHADDPLLTARVPGKLRAPQPMRVVLDTRLHTSPRARILRIETPGAVSPVLIAADPKDLDAPLRRAFDRRHQALRKAGGDVVLLSPGRQGRVPISVVLRALGKRGLQSVLVEGGNRIHGAFIAARLVDEVAFFIAPVMFGAGVPLSSSSGARWTGGLRLDHIDSTPLGPDILVSGRVVTRRPRL